MSADLTIGSTLVDNNTGASIGATGVSVPIVATPPQYVEGIQVVGTSEEAIQLGELAGQTLGLCEMINLDATNYVEVRVGTGSTKIVKLMPGEPNLFRFGSGITAPYWIANSSPCQVRYKIYNA